MSDCLCNCHTSGTAFQRPCDVLGGCGPHDERRCSFPCCFDAAASRNADVQLARPLWPGEDVFCRSCRTRYRRLLGWLLDDYLTIHAAMPTPIGGNGDRVTLSREYGHLAEWASDMKRRIADTIDEAANGLRDHQNHTPANPHRREARKLDTEWAYLFAHFDTLCTYPAAIDTAIELGDLHADIRRALGQTRPSYKLNTPCPSCDLLTMRRVVDVDRSDVIECMNCGETVKEELYDFYARLCVDKALGLDTPAA